MKAVVTGGTGFIGSHLVDALIEKDYQVVCSTRSNIRTKPSPRNGVEFVSIDDLIDGSYGLDGVTALFHLAAIHHRWGTSEADYLDFNVGLTQKLLERAQGRVGHFIYCSSIAVFGWPPRKPIDESFPYDPINIYGRSKVLCEKMVLRFHREGKILCSIIRPSITYGRRNPTGMLTKLAIMLDRGIYRTVGSGRNHVQLAHVSDIVQGFLRTLDNPEAHGRSYIITSESPVCINDLVQLVATEIGKPAPRWRVPQLPATAAALVLEALYALGWKLTGPEPMIAKEKIQVMTTDRSYSISRAQNELGYSPEYDYASGVEDFVKSLAEEGLLRPQQDSHTPVRNGSRDTSQ